MVRWAENGLRYRCVLFKHKTVEQNLVYSPIHLAGTTGREFTGFLTKFASKKSIISIIILIPQYTSGFTSVCNPSLFYLNIPKALLLRNISVQVAPGAAAVSAEDWTLGGECPRQERVSIFAQGPVAQSGDWTLSDTAGAQDLRLSQAQTVDVQNPRASFVWNPSSEAPAWAVILLLHHD